MGKISKKELKRYTDSIAEHTKRSGFSQRSLTEALGVSLSTVNSIAQSESDLKLSTLMSLCNLLGMTPDELTGYTLPFDDPTDEDAIMPYERLNQMESSLKQLYRGLTAIAKFSHDDYTPCIVEYVQNCIMQILHGQKLEEEKGVPDDVLKD